MQSIPAQADVQIRATTEQPPEVRPILVQPAVQVIQAIIKIREVRPHHRLLQIPFNHQREVLRVLQTPEAITAAQAEEAVHHPEVIIREVHPPAEVRAEATVVEVRVVATAAAVPAVVAVVVHPAAVAAAVEDNKRIYKLIIGTFL